MAGTRKPLSPSVGWRPGHGRDLFPTHFGSDIALVPAPGHAPEARGGKLRSTTVELARSMEAAGLGVRREWFRRRRKVPKSAWSRADRPTEERHHATIALSAPPVLGFDPVDGITVVDDVITSCVTLDACVRRLAEAFPSADVATFAVVRTISGVAQLSKAFDPVPEDKGLIVLNAAGSTRHAMNVRHRPARAVASRLPKAKRLKRHAEFGGVGLLVHPFAPM